MGSVGIEFGVVFIGGWGYLTYVLKIILLTSFSLPFSELSLVRLALDLFH